MDNCKICFMLGGIYFFCTYKGSLTKKSLDLDHSFIFQTHHEAYASLRIQEMPE